MNELRLCSFLFLILAMYILLIGIHNIDNAWNIKNFANNNEIMDCNGFICKNAESLYDLGTKMIIFASSMIMLALICLYIDTIPKK